MSEGDRKHHNAARTDDAPSATNKNSSSTAAAGFKVTAVHATGAPVFVTVAAPATFFALPLAGGVLPWSPLDGTADAQMHPANVDLAVSCCWMGVPTIACDIGSGTCDEGFDRCHSPYFTAANGFHTGYMECTPSLGTRGEQGTDVPRLFVAPRDVDLGDETIARLQALTAVTRLEYLAAMEPELAEKKYADPRGALADIGIEISEEMQISIVRDEDTGEDVVTVEGFGETEVLRYGSDGTIIAPDQEAAQ